MFKPARYCETGPTVYSPYPRRLESLTICWCNYKSSTFSSVILRPRVLVRPESNSQPPAWQPDAQPTEPPVCESNILIVNILDTSRRLWRGGKPVRVNVIVTKDIFIIGQIVGDSSIEIKQRDITSKTMNVFLPPFTQGEDRHSSIFTLQLCPL